MLDNAGSGVGKRPRRAVYTRNDTLETELYRWRTLGRSEQTLMMTIRLQRALQRIDEVSADQQDEIAALIEDALTPYLERTSYAGVLAGLLPDDAEEQLLHLRRMSPPPSL